MSRSYISVCASTSRNARSVVHRRKAAGAFRERSRCKRPQ
ncbi:hypothetical protein F8B43_1963 [Methylorubrum populi]|uniref:Uncharacterized protein n=1 Tax=Methylorubrum populi TaxID=223967 RepID=A0A833J8E8_9HYPH|nr:hypothetical protein F8B43_1963 [Methylorubrum populi]